MKKSVQASYTVEMALLMPLMLAVLFVPIYMGYEMYGRAKECFAGGWDQSFCAEEKIWDIKLAKEILEGLK